MVRWCHEKVTMGRYEISRKLTHGLKLMLFGTLAMACSHATPEERSSLNLPPQQFAEASPSKPPPKSPRLKQEAFRPLEDDIDELLHSSDIPGVSVGLIVDRKVFWKQAFGVSDRTTKKSMTTETVMRVGSVSKVFTGLALMALRDEGRFRLDDPVVSIVPELAHVVYPTSDSPRITFRHLLTHSSGLPRVGRLDYYSNPNSPVTTTILAEALSGEHLIFAPGTETLYSNLGSGVASVAVGRLAGKELRTYLSELIFQPLGMTHTTFSQKDARTFNMATGYKSTSEGLVPKPHWNLGVAEGMGGLYSSLDDVVRFAVWQTNAWPPRHGEETGPVARATVRESQLSLGGGNNSSVFGANWIIGSHPRFGYQVSHTGSTHQYSACIRLFPKSGVGIVTLANVGMLAKEPGKAAAAKIADTALSWLKKVLPKVEEPVSDALNKASNAFLALFDAPTEKQIAALFHPTFLASIPVPKMRQMFAGMRKQLGVCSVTSGTAKSKTEARFLLTCGTTKLNLGLVVSPVPPHQIQGMRIKPRKDD